MSFTLSAALSITALGVRTNMVPWARRCVTDTTPRGGFIYRYACWFDAQPLNSRVWLAYQRRPVGDLNGWEPPVVQSAVAGLNGTGTAADGHFAISLGVDPDGCVHTWWRAHNLDQVKYFKGSGPGDISITDDDPSALTATALTSSYNRPFTDANGDFFNTYRVGAPGHDAQQALDKWDNTLKVWVSVNERIIDWPGGEQVGDQRSPYMHNFYVNPVTNRWHWVWIWARGGTVGTNHTVSYMYSDDQGVTWHAADGSLVSLPAGGPSTHPAVVAVDVPENSGLFVHHGMTAFINDQPVIPYIAIDDEDPLRMALYVATYYVGEWLVTKVFSEPWELIDQGVEQPDLLIGHMIAVPQGMSVHLLYRSDFEPAGLRVRSCHTPELNVWTDPTTLIDTTTISPALDLGYNTFVHDERAWAAFGQLSGYLGGSSTNTRNYFADITGLPASPDYSVETTAFVDIMRPAPAPLSFADVGGFAEPAEVDIMRPAEALLSFVATTLPRPPPRATVEVEDLERPGVEWN